MVMVLMKVMMMVMVMMKVMMKVMVMIKVMVMVTVMMMMMMRKMSQHELSNRPAVHTTLIPPEQRGDRACGCIFDSSPGAGEQALC